MQGVMPTVISVPPDEPLADLGVYRNDDGKVTHGTDIIIAAQSLRCVEMDAEAHNRRKRIWCKGMASNLRLLIAEDDELVVLGLTLVMEQLGYDVCGVARTAVEAVDIAERHRPDLALVDVALANSSNGLCAAREISSRLGIPVVVCSAHATAAEAHAAGASHFLMKPFGIAALADAVSSAFRPNGSRAPLAAA
jgi:two-component system, response regulator PdtaR